MRGPNKGDFIVKLQSFVQYVLALAATFLLAACGGGGAATNGAQGGALNMTPTSGTFYAGEPATFVITGGRRPYFVNSSEPGVLPVPSKVDGMTFDVVPNNPGVVDSGLPPGALQVLSVDVTIQDSSGAVQASHIKVAQNFLTGYALFFAQSTCPLPSGATSIVPCAGGDTAIELFATFNGSLHGNEAYRLDVVRGNFAFFDPLSSTNTVTSSYTTLSDHDGKITAVLRIPANAPSQVAILRVTHLGTGASTDEVFTIEATTPVPLVLTAIPDTYTFTGTDATVCGVGSGDFFVFDGVPPYNAVSSTFAVQVTPASSGSQPGRFTVTVANTQVCPTAAPVIVTDSLGNRVTVTVTSSHGAAATPPPALAVAPAAITLACSTSGSVTVVGGTGAYAVASSHPRVNASVSGHTVSITRINGDGLTLFPTTAQVSVTDGASAVVVTVTVPANCP